MKRMDERHIERIIKKVIKKNAEGKECQRLASHVVTGG